jgi:guanyl-specific ribonuclease Sa
MTSRKSTLSAALSNAAGKAAAPEKPEAVVNAESAVPASNKRTVLIGAHLPPECRRVLKLIEADTGKNLQQLLGEAINDLAIKHGKPEPYAGL